MITVRMECQGVSPLLMNPMSDETLEAIRTGVRQEKRKDRKREEVAKEKIYTNGKGEAGIPAQNLFAALIEAGRQVKVDGRRTISTATSTQLPAFLSIQEYFLELTNGNGGRPKWEVDFRRGRDKNTGVAVALVRPRFDEWGFVANLELDEKQISEETARNLVSIAGSRVGLCDFRPACKGPFGRFRIAKWEQVNGSGTSTRRSRKHAKSKQSA